jgi:hypothetical protein
MQKAEVAVFHEAIGQDMLEEPAEKLPDVELGGSWAGTSRFTIGEGDGAVVEAHDTSVGDGAPEDIRGKGGEGRGAVCIGLTMDIPRDVPSLWVDMLQQPGLGPCFL